MAVKTAKAGSAGHTAGIFAATTLDGPEIGTLVAVIDRARHLPNRKTMGKQDPYCAMRLGKEAKKTETDRRGGQTPKWDQELRFTVHESPDYFRMKCSVFNDDKKTDMIGEAWLDLREVIVPGGGQNDLWHPLFFKGKSAGEIRVEMTFYDSRPQDETVLEKKREREKRQQARKCSPASSSGGGARQSGPREAVKRRPLPPGPGKMQQSPTVALPDAESVHTQICNDSRSDISVSAYHRPVERVWNHPDDFEVEYAASRNSSVMMNNTHQYLPAQENIHPTYQDHTSDLGQETHQQEDGRWQDDTHCSFEPQVFDNQKISSQDMYRHALDEQDWHESPPPLTPRSNHNQSPMSISSSPTGWPSPPSVPSTVQSPDPRMPVSHHRHSISPVKLTQYRDSPLRQSMTQYDNYEDQRDTGDQPEVEDAPPPPPTHRSSFGQHVSMPAHSQPQRSPPLPLQEQSYISQPPLDRSPLQAIERKYDPYNHTHSLPQSPFSQHGAPHPRLEAQKFPPRGRSYDDYVSADPRHSRRSENFTPAGSPGAFGTEYRTDEPASYTPEHQRPSNEPRDHYQSLDDYGYRGRQGAQRLSMQHEPQVYRSHVPLVRPRAISPNVMGVSQRKSVSPHPMSESDRDSVRGISNGADAHESLNPSPAVPFQPYVETPEQLKEAARLHEVEKIRDDSPIVGNDGRIIDPSDHLPADTWAPEYQRNSRKPEHVIRITTKGERMTSSPAATRPISISTTPQSLKSPAVVIPIKESRNRLQKQTPNRPLPTQPFQHSHSSPTISTMRSQDTAVYDPVPVRPDLPQQSHYSTPSPRGGVPPRPPMSDYSFDNGQNFVDSPHSAYSTGQSPAASKKEPFYPSPLQPTYGSPRNSYVHGWTPPQTRHVAFYDDGLNDSQPTDPLSAELRTIDIGPSRGGRTAARFGRGYGR